MKLLLREYLSTLKESQELDAIVPQLLLSMNITPLHTPQIGVRQSGVDIHAVGIDPKDRKRKNFLISIKRGNIDRSCWNTGKKQDVYPSLIEVTETYINKKLGVNEKRLPSKIVLCCGGELKQDSQDDWDAFQISHAKKGIQYDLWDGNRLATLIHEHLMNEFLFVGEAKFQIRRALSSLGDPDYDLIHYKKMLSSLLEGESLRDKKGNILQKRVVDAFRIIDLCLGMISHYSKTEGSLKHGLVASEFTLLFLWDFILNNRLEKKSKVIEKYYNLYSHYFNCSAWYFDKIVNHCFVRDAITMECRNSLNASIVAIEQIGLLSSMGISQIKFAIAEQSEEGINNAIQISKALEGILANNTVTSSLVFDGQVIDVCSAMYFLAFLDKQDVIKRWISDIVIKFYFSYATLEYNFPISSDSMDTLVEFEYRKAISKEKVSSISTLIPTLAYWCAVFDFEEEYEDILRLVNDELKHTCLQLWFPEKGIKTKMFAGYAAFEYGATEAPIVLPESLNTLKDRIKSLLDFAKNSDLEMVWNDCPPGLPFMSSRHFRNPVVPFFWLSVLDDKYTKKAKAKKNAKKKKKEKVPRNMK